MKKKTDWQMLHLMALNQPKGFESGIVLILRGLKDYIDTYQMNYGSLVHNDGVLGDGVADIAKGIRTLLNGDVGRLDCNSLDKELVEILVKCGEEV